MDKEPLRACLIYEFLSEQGGLEREIIAHAKFLKNAGFEVTILTCHYDKKIRTLLPFGDVSIRVLPKVHTRFEILNLAQCALGLHNLRRYKPDLVITYSFPSNFLARRLSAKRIFYMNHFPHAFYLSLSEKREWAQATQGTKRWISVGLTAPIMPFLKRLDRTLTKSAHLQFTNSDFTKKRLDSLYAIETEISYPPLDPHIRPSQKVIQEPYVFSSSRIIPDKKYEWLIEAVSHMKHKIPLYIAGTSEKSYREVLEKKAKKHKVTLRFLGRLNTKEIATYYTNASVFAFPTPGEDFGLVPAESVACGTPVVVWGDGAGPTEQIIDGVNGYHAKPYDRKDFGAKLDRVLDEDLKRKNAKAIIDSAQRFTYKGIEKKFMQAVDKVMAG